MPVDTRRTGQPGPLIYGLDQSPANPFAARLRDREQILRITERFDRSRAAVEQVVRQSEQPAIDFRHEGITG